MTALNDQLPAVLIANRGEIALRIMRTLKALDIKSIALFHDLDRDAPHVRAADHAVEIFGEPATQAYLDAAQIIKVAQDQGASAIHPGYGFLAENAGFAEAVAAAGLVFIGPNPNAIRAMGDKIESKKLAQRANVSTIPGTEDAVTDIDEAARIATDIGYPVMVKASAGGGGKGMRIAHDEAELRAVFSQAISEAKTSFGDDRVMLEKFITRPRHIEIQVLGDKHGTVIDLGERECSIQRRHQKIIEEAPSPVLRDDVRAAMAAQAVALAKAVNYDSTGTVEFILDEAQNFYFLEMNTRLQVEHPVTELVHGLDLVEAQLEVAAGNKVPATSSKATGHAIELRICAEDPDQDFMPAIGTIRKLCLPDADWVRWDAGIEEGSIVTPAFDPMLAKLIVYGDTRAQAIERAQAALTDLAVLGITTNAPYLNRILHHSAFIAGETITSFVTDHAEALLPPAMTDQRLLVALAAAALSDPAVMQQWHDTSETARHIGGWRN